MQTSFTERMRRHIKRKVALVVLVWLLSYDFYLTMMFLIFHALQVKQAKPHYVNAKENVDETLKL